MSPSVTVRLYILTLTAQAAGVIPLGRRRGNAAKLGDREPASFAENDFAEARSVPFSIDGSNATILPITVPEVNKWTHIMKQGFPENVGCDLTFTDDEDSQSEQSWARFMPMVSYLGT